MHRKSDQAIQTVVQTDVARTEGLIDEIQSCLYQRKHRERLAHSQDELPELKVVAKKDTRLDTAR